MNNIHKRKIIYFITITIITTIAAGFILYSLKNNLSIFLTPRQVAAEHIAVDKTFRIGGLVKINSVQRDTQSLQTQFKVTDRHNEILVRYNGVLPDLFREGSGVIAEGKLNARHEFIATMVLAKHDETYMPKNVYKAIRENAA